MGAIILSVSGFFLLLISDLSQMHGKKAAPRLIASIGYIAVIAAILFLLSGFQPAGGGSWILTVQVVLAILFSALLLYSVLLEIPLRSRNERHYGRRVFRQGTYGLARHPGLLWFLLFHLVLNSIYRDWHFLMISAVMVLLDLLLCLAEDIVVFPMIFPDYEEYRRQVHFLFPTSKKGCMAKP